MTEEHEIDESKKPSQTWIECDEAIAAITNSTKAEPHSMQCINAWLWSNRRLYQRAKAEWRTYSCTGYFPCNCTEVSGEWRLYRLYKLLKHVSKIHGEESFFRQALDEFHEIETDCVQTEKWLVKNHAVAEDVMKPFGMDMWAEKIDFNKSSYSVESVFYKDKGVYVKHSEFIYALRFLKTCYNENARGTAEIKAMNWDESDNSGL